MEREIGSGCGLPQRPHFIPTTAGQVIIRAMGQTFVVQNEPQPRPPTPAAGCDDEDEDPPTPTRSSSSSSSPADRTDDYRDIFSEFGGLPGADPSGATTLITSPDDTLVFSPVGSASSPLEEEEATPSVLPLSAAGKCPGTNLPDTKKKKTATGLDKDENPLTTMSI